MKINEFLRKTRKYFNKAGIVVKLIPFFISLGISYLIVKNTKSIGNGTAVFIKDDFVLNFFTVILSLAIAVIALLYSNVENIRESLYKVFKDKEDHIVELEKKIVNIFKELKDDTLFIFFSLVGSWIIIVIREIPEINIIIFKMNKKEVCYMVEMSLVMLSLYALLDIIFTLFKLSDVSHEFSQRFLNNKDK
ncbi:hypothetical protein Q2T46_02795 [Thermoanaerobacterium sp. CMT5567-10]|uniref:hypothetical protein n=1 Tax=Thermoanaerobacterium sp. CMT5567-10 TaxID=3061989 RepID=UPI0026DF428F|nr:hypothetical protein [Thermoanaerobacterium sp. CMT5567-10]WKV09403.1 hypothetical protein Q2T46_02795 [Thermoanaerobacterium sp. CMT5567-10]